jgi:hypothetical protein
MKWTKTEDLLLDSMWRERFPFVEMEQALKRPPAAIWERFQQLGYPCRVLPRPGEPRGTDHT